MNGYSKIKLVGSTKSRSIDFSDLLTSPITLKPIDEKTSPNHHPSKPQETKQITNPTNTHHQSPPNMEPEDGYGERFGVVLSRNSSVSSTASHKQGHRTTLQSAVKRAFSMRRSSSVSERYCRIHDQCVTLTSTFFDDDDDDEGMGTYTLQPRSVRRKNKKQNRSGRILKACKRFLGIY